MDASESTSTALLSQELRIRVLGQKQPGGAGGLPEGPQIKRTQRAQGRGGEQDGKTWSEGMRQGAEVVAVEDGVGEVASDDERGQVQGKSDPSTALPGGPEQCESGNAQQEKLGVVEVVVQRQKRERDDGCEAQQGCFGQTTRAPGEESPGCKQKSADKVAQGVV